MNYKISLHKNGKKEIHSIKKGTRLLDFLREQKEDIKAPCNGNGRCGKCRIKVEGSDDIPSANEASLLGSQALSSGFRLACYLNAFSDLDIYLDENEKEKERDSNAVILTDITDRSIEIDPIVKKTFHSLPAPDLENQSSDADRVLQITSHSDFYKPSLSTLMKLPFILRRKNFEITLLHFRDLILTAEPGNTTEKIFGIAIDVGTTTIAAYLYELNTGKRIAVHSVLNPQRKYGADVISRIDYTSSSQAAALEMNRLIIDCINEIISVFANKAAIDKNDIYAAVFAGNTTMMHFLMGLPAINIAVSPFIPAYTGLYSDRPGQFGLEINPDGISVILPSVAGYIGADTVAAVLSTNIHENDKISLLIDIGTNGEIVLGCKDWLYACSTAAGPAFEGANIRNGIGGVRGAIDKLYFSENEGVVYSTIGGEPAIGICGSGIVDAVAGMLKEGIIDETGRIIDEKNESLPDVYKKRMIKIDNQRAFLISSAWENASGIDIDMNMDIAITQKDIRELQNAKAAIAAGIKTLIKRAGVTYDEVEKVYLAGGFGSYIDIRSALTIGLLPFELNGRIEVSGNSAGAGAVHSLLSATRMEVTEKISKMIKNIELSASPDFVDEYVNCMLFE